MDCQSNSGVRGYSDLGGGGGGGAIAVAIQGWSGDCQSTVGVKKKFPSPVRTKGRLIPFRSRLISVQLPFLSVFKPFPFCPTGSPSVLVNGPYGVIKHAQSLIAVISAGRLATVQ